MCIRPPQFACLSLVGALLLPTPLVPQDPIETPDVHALASMIQAEIEDIRWYMGRPAEDRELITVSNVTIRQNFRQAITLWQKVNQLGIELVGGGEPPPLVALAPGEVYGPRHVEAVLSRVEARLQEIRAGSGIVGVVGFDAPTRAASADPSATPTDVFRSLVQSNRQLNRMLERPVQPGDAYQQVQQAIYSMSTILAVLGDPVPLPPPPEYEPGRTPAHVYAELLEVSVLIVEAFEALGLGVVVFERGEILDGSLTSGDVFDLATLLLSEIDHLATLLPEARPSLQVAHPGGRVPSDVYQQTQVLRDQSQRLLGHARSRPERFEGAS